MATITGNSVYADPTQWWTLDYTFANSKFTWSVTCHASHTSYWNSIYGLTVNIGGNSYYKGDIDWRNYTPNTVVYNGVTNLSDCTVSGGQVTLSVSGNFYYGTWNTDYRSSGSGTCAVDPPTVATLTYTATNQYSSMVVAGRSVITFTMKSTSQTGSNTITYSLYQNGSVISTTTGSSGVNKTVNVTAPSAGTHTYKYTATDGNGTSTTSGNVSITTYAYQPPSFNSASAVRWSTGNSSGVASDTGKYAKCTATWNVGKVGTTNLTTTLKVSTSSPAHSTTTTTSGTAVWIGSNDYSADNSYTVTFLLYDNYTGEPNGVTRTDTLTQGGRGIDLIYANGHYGIAIGQKATANQFDVNMTTNVNTGNFNVPNGNAYIGTEGDTSAQRISLIRAGAGTMGMYSDASTTGNRALYFAAHGTGSFVNAVKADTNNNVTFYGDTLNLGSLEITQSPGVVTNAVTRTSGWAITTQRLVFWGKVAQLFLQFTPPASGTGYTGNRIFNGTIASAYKPYYTTTGAGFFTNNSSGSHSFGGYVANDGSIILAYQDDTTFSGGSAYITFTYILGV